MTGLTTPGPGAPVQTPQSQQDDEPARPKQLPRGVVLGPDGKPCRSCTSFASWAAMTKQQQQPQTSSRPFTTTTAASNPNPPLEPPPDCPPDVDQLGRSTWTLLHALTANYPEAPTATQQAETTQFLGLFSKLYPCWSCAADFREWMAEEEGGKRTNAPRVRNRDEFGRWMCEAHNAVNVKLGKPAFDCNRWEERWRTGWKDGRCD